MRRLARTALTLAGLCLLAALPHDSIRVAAQRPPNVIIVFADDLGYGDVGLFSDLKGAARPRTPNLDRMAAEGTRLTSFYVAQAVCSASRAALLTGSYSNRIGITGALNPRATTGIHAGELTLAELLKTKGYATAAIGKWHLGHERPFLPLQHGFDEYLGLPYSNDMWPRHPTQKNYPDLPLIEGNAVAEVDPDQARLTARYTERAVAFIERHRDKPFFLYLAHAMPHVPLFVSDAHKGKSGLGLYGDVIEEIDWSVGRVLDAVRRASLDDDTLVIFTSDNGPWLSYGNHGGSSGGLREGKGTAFEGGTRVPFIARWPGRIAKGRAVPVPAMTIDLLPTIARVANVAVPSERIIDGRDILPLLTTAASGAGEPHDALYFYWGTELHAVRSGRWKLHLPHPYQSLERAGNEGSPGAYVRKEIELSLFDLEADRGETTNVAARHPDVVSRLQAIAERARDDLGDSLTGRTGRNVRPSGRIDP